MRNPVLAFIAVTFALGLHLACGSSNGTTTPPVCGNGVQEKGEQCDHGSKNGTDGDTCSKDCKSISVARATIIVKWELVKHTAVSNYMGTNCDAVGADTTLLILNGPSVHVEMRVPCAQYQQRIVEVCTTPDMGVPDCARLPPGNYQATVELIRDSDQTAVTRSVSSATLPVVGANEVDFPIDIRQEDFLLPYNGSLLLDLSWGAPKMDCKGAMPPVVMESLWLSLNEMMPPVTMPKMTKLGTPLNGTQSPCVIPADTNHFYEEAAGLPWGPYRLHIKGYAAGQMDPAYCGAYDVFVGPGPDTQPARLIVSAAPTTDGGVSCPDP